jgi:hypothetical protein
VDTMIAKAQAARGLGQTELANSVLTEAMQVAEKVGSKRTSWRILCLLSQWAMSDGEGERARTLKAQARAALEPIVESLNPEWRESFLGTSDAAWVWSK